MMTIKNPMTTDTGITIDPDDVGVEVVEHQSMNDNYYEIIQDDKTFYCKYIYPIS